MIDRLNKEYAYTNSYVFKPYYFELLNDIRYQAENGYTQQIRNVFRIMLNKEMAKLKPLIRKKVTQVKLKEYHPKNIMR